jgi:hypothetical protein
VTTTYLSTVALDRIEAAQQTLARHVVSSLNGRCEECLAEGACRDRIQALRVLAAYGALPRRQPGATRPDRAEFGQHLWPERYDRLVGPVALEHPTTTPVAVEPIVAVEPVIVEPARSAGAEPVGDEAQRIEAHRIEAHLVEQRRGELDRVAPERVEPIIIRQRRPTLGRHARLPG